jgi:phosphoribosylformimino-5-aminoimidazole carboxamide ribotide isomerase
VRVIPVLDLKGGVVVRGVGGRRDEYRPVVSTLTDSARPLDVARAFRDRLGLSEYYLADLDAIAGGPPALDVYRALAAEGFRLWVDAGLRDAADAAPLGEAAVARVVAGLETLAGPDVLSRTCATMGAARVVFSLDLKGEQPLGDAAAWGNADPYAIAEAALRRGVRHVIVLDLARVGVSGGTGTEALCARIVGAHPGVAVIAGGGVRDAADLLRLRRVGVKGVLVASALHDGRLGRADLEALGRA